MRARFQRIKEELRRRRHLSIPEQGKWLRQVVIGYLRVPRGSNQFQENTAFPPPCFGLWRRALSRRSQKDRTTWERMLRSPTGCPLRASFILGLKYALTSNTQGGSPVRELRPLGSVRGVRRKAHSYREQHSGVPAIGPVNATGCNGRDRAIGQRQSEAPFNPQTTAYFLMAIV